MIHSDSNRSLPVGGDKRVRYGKTKNDAMHNDPSQSDAATDALRPQQERTKALLFTAGALVLLAVSIFLLFAVIGPGGSDGLLFKEGNPALDRIAVGVVLPTLDTEYYDQLAQSLQDEADYYEWRVEIMPVSVAGSELGALEQLLRHCVETVIIDPLGSDEKTIQALEDRCEKAGVPSIFLLNDGERYNCCSSSVSYNLEYLSVKMAHESRNGNVYIVGLDPESEATRTLEEGLLRDPHYGILIKPSTKVLGISYVDEDQTAKDIVLEALNMHPEIETFFLLNPDIVPDALSALDQAGYTGTVYCYAYEADVGARYASAKTETIRYSYFHYNEAAYYCLLAVADQLEYGKEPQYYTINPYTR